MYPSPPRFKSHLKGGRNGVGHDPPAQIFRVVGVHGRGYTLFLEIRLRKQACSFQSFFKLIEVKHIDWCR